MSWSTPHDRLHRFLLAAMSRGYWTSWVGLLVRLEPEALLVGYRSLRDSRFYD
jgi:hypothetical protein